jgi:hypothetical protein
LNGNKVVGCINDILQVAANTHWGGVVIDGHIVTARNGSGSVAEKIPYVMESFEQHPAKNSILILGGAYWATKPGIKVWAIARAKRSGKNIQVVYENELGDWLEQTDKRCTTK